MKIKEKMKEIEHHLDTAVTTTRYVDKLKEYLRQLLTHIKDLEAENGRLKYRLNFISEGRTDIMKKQDVKIDDLMAKNKRLREVIHKWEYPLVGGNLIKEPVPYKDINDFFVELNDALSKDKP